MSVNIAQTVMKRWEKKRNEHNVKQRANETNDKHLAIR